MNSNIWNNNSGSDGIFSCILEDQIFNNNNNTNKNALTQETIDQLIVVGLKYKKKCKKLQLDLDNVKNKFNEIKNQNTILENKNNHYIKLLEEQESILNQQYINDINILKDEKMKEFEYIKAELIAEKAQTLKYKQKYESLDSIYQLNRKRDNQSKDELIQHNNELIQHNNELKLELKLNQDKIDNIIKDFETEKMNILLSRDKTVDSERSSLLRRALIAEEKIEKILTNSETVKSTSIDLDTANIRIKELEKQLKEYELMLKLSREQLLGMNNEMVHLIESKERIQKATQSVLEENKELKEHILKIKK
jgi:hypothetical protein